MEQQSDLEKRRLRLFYGGKRRDLTPECRRKYDRMICEHIRKLEIFRAAECAAFFIAWGAEPDLSQLFCEKRTFLPRFNAVRQEYELVEISDVQKELIPGKYNIPEPRPEIPAADPEFCRKEMLFIVPAVACDTAGTRLGRGGGFYDRLLCGVQKAPVAAIYSCQLAPQLPYSDHDRPMGYVVTEKQSLEI